MESEVQHRFKAHLERNIKAGLRPVNDLEAVSTAQYAKAGYEEDIDQCQNDRQSDCLQSQFAEQDRDDRDDRDVLAYEHRALESILVATANALEEEMMFTRKLVQHLLADLEDDINRENLKRLLHYSRRMVGFQSRARYVKRSVDEILENGELLECFRNLVPELIWVDEDLSAMYLTSTARGRPRALHDHEQLELLLESFAKQTEEILSEVDTTVANVQVSLDRGDHTKHTAGGISNTSDSSIVSSSFADNPTVDSRNCRTHVGLRTQRSTSSRHQSQHRHVGHRVRCPRSGAIRYECELTILCITSPYSYISCA